MKSNWKCTFFSHLRLNPAGRTGVVGGPHAARGPQVARDWLRPMYSNCTMVEVFSNNLSFSFSACGWQITGSERSWKPDLIVCKNTVCYGFWIMLFDVNVVAWRAITWCHVMYSLQVFTTAFSVLQLMLTTYATKHKSVTTHFTAAYFIVWMAFIFDIGFKKIQSGHYHIYEIVVYSSVLLYNGSYVIRTILFKL